MDKCRSGPTQNAAFTGAMALLKGLYTYSLQMTPICCSLLSAVVIWERPTVVIFRNPPLHYYRLYPEGSLAL